MSRAAFGLVAALVALAPVHADDRTHLIEFDRRSTILAADVNVNGSVVVGGSDGNGGYYWMPTTGDIYIGGVTATGVSGDGTRIVGTADDRNGVRNAAIGGMRSASAASSATRR